MKNFFIIGSPKTGTTLLARLIDSHPEIACTTELFPFHMKGGKRVINPAIKQKWKDHGFKTHDNYAYNFMNLKLNINDNAFVKMFFHEDLFSFGNKCNASIVGDKFPWYIGFIDDMLEMFPDAHYIYNVRDPRAVWNSAKHFTHVKRADSLLMQMLSYDKKLEKYWGLMNLIYIKYEPLINDEISSMHSIYSFLGFPDAPYSKDYNDWKNADIKYPARFKGIPNSTKPLDSSICTKWKTQMTAKEVRRVTNMSMDFIKKYGYGE